MKTMTLTALVAFLVAIPVALMRKRIHLTGVNRTDGAFSPDDETLRYAIDDFLT